MSETRIKSIRIATFFLSAFCLVWLCACPGWGSSPFVEEPRVAFDAEGYLHIAVTRAVSTEGGPYGHTLHHIEARKGIVLGAYLPAARQAYDILSDGQRRMFMHVLDAKGSTEGAFRVFELDQWRALAPGPNAQISEDLLELLRNAGGLYDKTGIWCEAEGLVRIAVPHRDDQERPGSRVFTIEAGYLTRVDWAPLPEACSGFFQLDPLAPGGPVALLSEEGQANSWLAAQLHCNDSACAWDTGSEDRITVDEDPGKIIPFVVTAEGVAVLVRTVENEDSQPGIEIVWPGGSKWIDSRPDMFWDVARGVSEGFVMALYRGHDARTIDLIVVDSEFEHRVIEIDLDGKYAMYLQLLVHQPDDEPWADLFFSNGSRVYQRAVNLSSGAQESYEYAF